MMYLNSYAFVTDSQLILNGNSITFPVTADTSYLTQAYRHLKIEYPKFFKMDTLCKAGFLASELLMGKPATDTPLHDWAVVSFSSTSSLNTDIHYQQTIAHADNYYPSPSLFVYTLANIMNGEISIRHKIQGESSSYILPAFDADVMIEVVEMLHQRTPRISNILLSWADCINDHVEVFMCHITIQSNVESLPLSTFNLSQLRNKIKID